LRSGAGCLGAAGPGDEGPGARGEGATAESPKKKVLKLKVMEKEIRKSNPTVILGGNVDLWIAGVLVKKITTASTFHLNFRKF
jgi:hypothetical protein